MSTIHLDKTLYQTKPTDANRLKKELAVYDLLDSLNIPFIRIDHDATATIEDCDKVDALLQISICKNLFLCNGSKTAFYLLMLPGTKKFITKNLSKQLECSRLSFASAEYMERYLNLSPGSVSILGLMNDTEHKIQLLIDKDLLAAEYLGCHPCINTSSLKLKTSDVLEKFLTYTGHSPIIV